MTAKIAAAFVAAQAELTNPPKKSKANTGTYSYTYADLPAIIDHVRPVLAKHGLGISQDVLMEDGRLLIRTRIIHSSGECLEFGPLAGSVGGEWQKVGSGITYARRYALAAALGIAADEDDDAATAAPPSSASTKKGKTLRAVEKAADEEDIRRWVELISSASSWVELKSIADEIAAHRLDESERVDLLAMWTARKAEIS
jgi:hypothetical protein